MSSDIKLPIEITLHLWKQKRYQNNLSFGFPDIKNNVEEKMNIKFKMSTICRKSNADTTDCFLNANFGD